VALMYGAIEEQHYEDPYLHDKRLLDLVDRVRCLPSDEADRVEKEMNVCDLEVVLKSGPRKNVRVEYHRGALEEADDRHRSRGEIPRAGAPTAAGRADRQSAALVVGAREPAAGRRAHRDDAGLIAAPSCRAQRKSG
jgi:2-methylcitrate dehydratase PrpD